MTKIVVFAFILAAALAATPVLAASSPATAMPAATASAAPAAMPAGAAAGAPALHHLVYEFGYNTKAASKGPSTGTTTIDLVGIASDGGMTVKATDNWWNSTNPKQSAVCEVYANGGVTCSQAPYHITAIQLSIVSLLGHDYFKPLAGGLKSSWKQDYQVKATFAPSVNRGFAGQVYTWNFDYSVNGAGTLPEQPPLILIHQTGTIAQQGGTYVKLNQKANILFDPRLKIPVLVNNLSTFVPQKSTASYSIELKLVQYK